MQDNPSKKSGIPTDGEEIRFLFILSKTNKRIFRI